MEQLVYDNAFDILGGCVPDCKTVYSIPMELLTPKLAAKLASIPDAVYLAHCDKINESFHDTNMLRMLLGFGDHAFEAFFDPSKSRPNGEFVIAFTPSVRSFEGNEHVVLLVSGFSQVIRPTYIYDEGEEYAAEAAIDERKSNPVQD